MDPSNSDYWMDDPALVPIYEATRGLVGTASKRSDIGGGSNISSKSVNNITGIQASFISTLFLSFASEIGNTAGCSKTQQIVRNAIFQLSRPTH